MDGIIDSVDRDLNKLQETERTWKHSVLQSMGSQRVEYYLEIEQQHRIYAC